MTQGQKIIARRAQPGDADKIAAFVNRGRRGRTKIDKFAVIERFGNVGLMLAEQNGDLVGMLGWRAENLIVRVTDFLISSTTERTAVGRALLSKMEQAAKELQCESVLLFLPSPHPPKLVEFCGLFGYEPQAVADLPRAWRDAVQESHVGNKEMVLVKKLRSGRVLRPM